MALTMREKNKTTLRPMISTILMLALSYQLDGQYQEAEKFSNDSFELSVKFKSLAYNRDDLLFAIANEAGSRWIKAKSFTARKEYEKTAEELQNGILLLNNSAEDPSVFYESRKRLEHHLAFLLFKQGQFKQSKELFQKVLQDAEAANDKAMQEECRQRLADFVK